MNDLGNERRSEIAQVNFPDLSSMEISQKMQLASPSSLVENLDNFATRVATSQ